MAKHEPSIFAVAVNDVMEPTLFDTRESANKWVEAHEAPNGTTYRVCEIMPKRGQRERLKKELQAMLNAKVAH